MTKDLKNLLELIGDGIVIAVGILMVITFWFIKYRSVYYIMENNPIIRDVEFYGAFIIILFGLYLLIRDVISIRKKDG